MSKLTGTDLSSTIQALGEDFAASLRWEWDDRFFGVLAVFEAADRERMWAALTARFDQAWDCTSIGAAPGSISGAIQDFGGLTADQRLFAAELEGDVIMLGFWWPWGNGTNISIRFIPHGPGISGSAEASARADLRRVFSIQDAAAR